MSNAIIFYNSSSVIKIAQVKEKKRSQIKGMRQILGFIGEFKVLGRQYILVLIEDFRGSLNYFISMRKFYNNWRTTNQKKKRWNDWYVLIYDMLFYLLYSSLFFSFFFLYSMSYKKRKMDCNWNMNKWWMNGWILVSSHHNICEWCEIIFFSWWYDFIIHVWNMWRCEIFISGCYSQS